MNFELNRRDVLTRGVPALFALSAGCQEGSDFGGHSPEELDVKVDNEIDTKITAQMALIDDQKIIWENEFILSSNESESRETDLHGTDYLVSAVITPDDASSGEEYRDGWVWNSCRETTIYIRIFNSDINVFDNCYPD